MNDCENEVYTRIANVLRTEFPGINLSGSYVKSPSSFPHVCIMMNDNSVIPSMLDSGNGEISQVMFEINIYSNKTEGRKTECKSIAKKIDEIMSSMNFRRMALNPVPNMEDATIYRLVSRYRGATDGKFFYRR